MCDEPFCWYNGVRRHLDADYETYDGPWTHFDNDGNPIDDSSVKYKWSDQRRTV